MNKYQVARFFYGARPTVHYTAWRWFLQCMSVTLRFWHNNYIVSGRHRGIVFSLLCLFVSLWWCWYITENSHSGRDETFSIDGRRLCDQTVKCAKWQHPAMGREGKFAWYQLLQLSLAAIPCDGCCRSTEKFRTTQQVHNQLYTLWAKKHVTTSSIITWTRIVRLQQVLAHLLPRV